MFLMCVHVRVVGYVFVSSAWLLGRRPNPEMMLNFRGAKKKGGLVEKPSVGVRQLECEFGHSGQSVPRQTSSPQPLQRDDTVSHDRKNPHVSASLSGFTVEASTYWHYAAAWAAPSRQCTVIGCDTTYISVIYLLYLLQLSGLMLVSMLALYLHVFFCLFFFLKCLVCTTDSQIHSPLKLEREQEDVVSKRPSSVRDCQKRCSIGGLRSLQQDIISFVWSKKNGSRQQRQKNEKKKKKSLLFP